MSDGIIDRIHANMSKFYFQLYYWHAKRSDFQKINLLEKEQFDDTSIIYERKFQRLKDLLLFSEKNVPYYREMFENRKIVLANIKDMNDFAEIIPVLRKQDILENYNKFIAEKVLYPPTYKNSTGGSTGIALNFLQDMNYASYKGGARSYNMKWTGWKYGEKIAYLWGANRDYEADAKKRRIKELITNEIFLNSFNMDIPKMEAFVKRLNSFRPRLVVGYANSLLLFSKYLIKNNLQIENIDFNIQSSAETLTEEMRSTIEKAFKGPKVFNSYGSREVAALAHECEHHNGLHINEQINHLEIVRKNTENQQDKFGKVIVTDFTNYIFPFIRYENGDISELIAEKKCACGRNLQKIKTVYGRTSDFIKTPSGKIIHGEYFTHLFYEQKFIGEFQVVQETLDGIVINYKLISKIFDKKEFETFLLKIEKKTKDEIDPQLNLTFNEVEEIPLLKSGKKKFTLSKLDIDF